VNIKREGDNYIVQTSRVHVTFEGLGALLSVVGMAGIVLLILLAAIF
jgi:hypothetical protein